MRSDIVSDMKDVAYFVAGRHPWDRSNTDPLVKTSLEDAIKLLDHVGDSIGTPLVSGGTTSNPQVIITLAWLADSTDQSVGIYVDFYGRHRCSITIAYPDNHHTKKDNISIDEVLRFNIKSHFMIINEQARPYRLDTPHL